LAPPSGAGLPVRGAIPLTQFRRFQLLDINALRCHLRTPVGSGRCGCPGSEGLTVYLLTFSAIPPGSWASPLGISNHMRAFADAPQEDAIVHQVGAQLPWKHPCVLVDNLGSPELWHQGVHRAP